MLPALIFRTLRSANKRCIAKFCWNFGVKGMLSVERFKRRLRRGGRSRRIRRWRSITGRW